MSTTPSPMLRIDAPAGLGPEAKFMLGRGSYGLVLASSLELPGTALKLMSMSAQDRGSHFAAVHMASAVLEYAVSQASPAQAVQQVHLSPDGRYLGLQMPLQGMSLRRLSSMGILCSPAVLACMLHDVLTSLTELNALGLSHRDVKVDNMILQPEGTVTLIDYGISGSIFQARPNRNVVTYRYRPPEIEFGMRYGASVDVWSLAVAALEELRPHSALRSTRTALQALVCITQEFGGLQGQPESGWSALSALLQMSEFELSRQQLSKEDRQALEMLLQTRKESRKQGSPNGGSSSSSSSSGWIDQFLCKCLIYNPRKRPVPAEMLEWLLRTVPAEQLAQGRRVLQRAFKAGKQALFQPLPKDFLGFNFASMLPLFERESIPSTSPLGVVLGIKRRRSAGSAGVVEEVQLPKEPLKHAILAEELLTHANGSLVGWFSGMCWYYRLCYQAGSTPELQLLWCGVLALVRILYDNHASASLRAIGTGVQRACGAGARLCCAMLNELLETGHGACAAALHVLRLLNGRLLQPEQPVTWHTPLHALAAAHAPSAVPVDQLRWLCKAAWRTAEVFAPRMRGYAHLVEAAGGSRLEDAVEAGLVQSIEAAAAAAEGGDCPLLTPARLNFWQESMQVVLQAAAAIGRAG